MPKSTFSSLIGCLEDNGYIILSENRRQLALTEKGAGAIGVGSL